MNLLWYDWLFVIVYIVFVFYSGSIVKKYIGGISDYLVANRGMQFHLGLLSLMCTEIGMITYMYFAELGYKTGFTALIVGIPPFLVFLFLGKTGFIIKPLLDMKIMTLPELFEKKFTKGVRFYAGVLMAIGGILNFGVFPGVEAKFVNIITGISEKNLLATMIVMLTVVLIYTIFGGMVSVLVTNYLQYALLSFGMIFITIVGILKIGFPNIINAVKTGMGERGINPFYPSAFGSDFGVEFILWQLLGWTALLTSWQAVAMRIFSSKDTKTGRKIFTWSSLMFFSRAILPIFWGIMAFAYLGKVDDSITALPLMLVKIIPKGFIGIIFAALLAASMSTYSSYLLSWSSVISEDIIGTIVKNVFGKDLKSKTRILISRITMGVIMIFIIWWSLFYGIGDYLFFYLNMTITLFVPGTLIVVVFAIYFKKKSFGIFRARNLGAYLAFTLGAFPTIWYFFPKHPVVGRLGTLAYLLALVGMIAGSVVANIVKPLKADEEG